MFSIFSKGAQPFGFIKPYVIWKLNYNVKYVTQTNGGMIMFFKNSIIVGSIVNNMEESIQKKEHYQYRYSFKVLR